MTPIRSLLLSLGIATMLAAAGAGRADSPALHNTLGDNSTTPPIHNALGSEDNSPSAQSPYSIPQDDDDRAAVPALGNRLTVTFSNTALEAVLSEVSKRAGVRMDIQWQKLQDAGIRRDTPVTLQLVAPVAADTVLRLLVMNVGDGRHLGWSAGDDGVVVISTVDAIQHAAEVAATTGPQIVRVYDVDNFVRDRQFFEGGDSVQNTIRLIVSTLTSMVAPDTWRDAGGTTGSLREIDHLLIVTQTARNHKQLEKILAQMRDTINRRKDRGTPCGPNWASPINTPDYLPARMHTALKLAIDNMPLRDALSKLSMAYGIKINANWQALQRAGTDANTPVSVQADSPITLEIALNMLCSPPTGRIADWLVRDDGVIIFSTGDDLQSATYQSVRKYDINDLIGNDLGNRTNAVQALEATITSAIAPDVWEDDGGTIGTNSESGGVLTIRQTEANHRAIATLLTEIRAALAARPSGA